MKVDVILQNSMIRLNLMHKTFVRTKNGWHLIDSPVKQYENAFAAQYSFHSIVQYVQSVRNS